MVELIAVINLEDAHLAQALNYLKAYNKPVGLLINFGSKSLQFKKVFNKALLSKSSQSQNQVNPETDNEVNGK